MNNVNCHKLTFGEQDSEKYEVVKYTPNPLHRNNSPQKSQWLILENEEVECFRIAYDKGWKNGGNAWGLYYKRDRLDYLGIGTDRTVRLFIAKFKNDSSHNAWHGYPADHQRHQQDIPDESILRSWITNKVLAKAKIRKIGAGQPCSLSN